MDNTTHTAPTAAAKTFVTFTVDGSEYECSELAFGGPAVTYANDGGTDNNRAYWIAVQSIACPHCIASGGGNCTDKAGNVTGYHARRVARAKRLGRVA